MAGLGGAMAPVQGMGGPACTGLRGKIKIAKNPIPTSGISQFLLN
jgi:hypothetical protein